MPGLRELQHDFLNYLLEKPSAIVKNIVSTAQMSAQQRVDLYADGYKIRLKEAIMTDYEQLHAYLGDDMFEQLMNEYIASYPSQHPNLRYFSKHMMTLLAEKEPWTQAPELIEIATIEKTFCDSFDAADCATVSLQDLSKIAPDSLPTLTMQFHASVQVLAMKYNSFQIWQALSKGDNPPALIDDPTTWLVWRSDLISRYIAISAAEVCAINIMIAGGDFSDMCEALLDYYDEQDTPQQAVGLLQAWTSKEMLCVLE